MKGYRFQVLGCSLILCLLFTVTCTLSTAYASENIGQSRISPASPLYFLKTIRENIELKFAATPRVGQIRQLEFATRRLREVKSLIPITRQDLIEPTLERYWYHLQAVDNAGEVLGIHIETLESIYSQVSNKRARMAIRATVNRIVQRADLLGSAKVPACNFLTKEASSSGLNEVEREILSGRGSNCYFK